MEKEVPIKKTPLKSTLPIYLKRGGFMKISDMCTLCISIVFLVVLSPGAYALAPTIDTPSPQNKSINQPTNLTFSWVGNDPDGDVVNYTVYLSALGNSNPNRYYPWPSPIQICSGTSTTCTISGLNTITNYQWIVAATDSTGLTAESYWVFTTGTTDSQADVDERIIALENKVEQQNATIEALRSETNNISGILNTLKEFTHKIYNALSNKLQKEIGPWPF